MQKRKKSVLYIALTALFILAALLAPLPEGLTRQGLCSIALLLGAIFLWITKALPIAITAVLFTTAMPFFGILKLNEVFVRFGNNTFFFMIATYCLTIAISSSSIPNRVSVCLLRLAGTSPTKLLFYFAFGTAAFSSIMSNVPSCAIFCALILSLLRESCELRENRALVKVLLIAVTYGAVIGGFSTPAGSSANIFSMNLFAELTGKEISFLQWVCVGLPTAVLCLALCCLCLLLIFRPKPIGCETLEAAKKAQKSCGPLSAREWKILIITCAMLICWILGTWIPGLNATTVALLGMCLFFFPGVEALSWKQVTSELPWGTIFLIGGSGALAYGISVTGADLWLVETVLPNMLNMNAALILLICAGITAVLHMLIPSGSATIAIALPTFLQLTRATGLSDVTIMMICTMWSCVVLVMPIDAVTMVTYSTGEYEMRDLLKAGIPIYLILIPLSTWLVQFLSRLIF